MPRKVSRVYLYVVDHDLGFAPNPYHGVCTLATCKPGIRSTAQVGDWVIGLGGKSLKATGKCIFAMRVTKKITFNQYWSDPEFNNKKPVRNGSKKMLAGDNIYYLDAKAEWHQAPSIHSNPDGSVNSLNLVRDTKSSNVLLSTHFYYFGSDAVTLPDGILRDLGYENGRNHRFFKPPLTDPLIQWLENEYQDSLNLVLADPFDFDKADKSYSLKSNRMV
jgi:Nucleotide modification associated domain 2